MREIEIAGRDENFWGRKMGTAGEGRRELLEGDGNSLGREMGIARGGRWKDRNGSIVLVLYICNTLISVDEYVHIRYCLNVMGIPIYLSRTLLRTLS